ncbi:aminoglycoside phosphotransferase family protein [Nisaea acidiphila]|uniref:Aminoglycoside phosphotransferase family protein n=1 Tax=Nisaea acidiphila TaxID=1862145 RepID=A0A9J7ALD3_9PROT|nr:aminoglycoside phosphotransferase family protein [Nisaea acidiphila]UUX47975.1 aminoglycoside phosphotransferase family protein [Nisaea acidiphila]
MTTDLDLRNLHAELMKLNIFHGLALEDLIKLPARGLTHDHVLLGDRAWKGRRLLARVPRLARRDMTPEEALFLQAESFRRAAPSRHTPELHWLLDPCPRLPNGALVVDAVEGKPAQLPRDLREIAETLASVHRLPVPEKTAPLPRVVRPIEALVGLIEAQAEFVPALVAGRDARAILEEECKWARSFAAEHGETPLPPTLVLTDTHPGNYVLQKDGRAIFVDMEKTQYGSPAIDLAHASLHTSVTWDPDVSGEVSRDDVVEFYETYMTAVPPSLARSLEPWLLPFRRLTWLRTTTWGCKWYAENEAQVSRSGDGQRERMLKGVLERLRAMVRRETMERVRGEWLGPDRLELE